MMGSWIQSCRTPTSDTSITRLRHVRVICPGHASGTRLRHALVTRLRHALVTRLRHDSSAIGSPSRRTWVNDSIVCSLQFYVSSTSCVGGALAYKGFEALTRLVLRGDIAGFGERLGAVLRTEQSL